MSNQADRDDLPAGSDSLPVVSSDAYFVHEIPGNTCERYRDAGEWAAITAAYLLKKRGKP